MASRLELQTKLEELLGSRNVYYQPPESVKMEYPAIRYSKKKPDTKYANNKVYMKTNCYEIIVISRKPDEVKEAVMDEIKGMEAHDITQNTIKEIVDEKEEELAKEQNDENKQRTPWGDAEERDAKRRA